MSDTKINIDEEFEARIAERMEMKRREQSCSISLSPTEVWVRLDQPLQDGPHKPTRMETMLAGALLGIARTLTGRGEEAVIDAMAAMEKKVRAKR